MKEVRLDIIAVDEYTDSLAKFLCDGGASHAIDRTLLPLDIMELDDIIEKLPFMAIYRVAV